MAGQLGAADATDRPTRLESHAPLSNIATACVPDPPLRAHFRLAAHPVGAVPNS